MDIFESFISLLLHELVDEAVNYSEGVEEPLSADVPVARSGLDLEDISTASTHSSAPVLDREVEDSLASAPASAPAPMPISPRPLKRLGHVGQQRATLSQSSEIGDSLNEEDPHSDSSCPPWSLEAPFVVPVPPPVKRRRLGVSPGAHDQIRVLQAQLAYLTSDRDFYRSKVQDLENRVNGLKAELAQRDDEQEELSSALQTYRQRYKTCMEQKLAEDYEEQVEKDLRGAVLDREM